MIRDFQKPVHTHGGPCGCGKSAAGKQKSRAVRRRRAPHKDDPSARTGQRRSGAASAFAKGWAGRNERQRFDWPGQTSGAGSGKIVQDPRLMRPMPEPALLEAGMVCAAAFEMVDLMLVASER